MLAVNGGAEFLKQIGSNVRRWRVRRALTQEELAAATETTPRYIQRVEAGRTNVSALYLLRLALVLETNPAALVRAGRIVERRPGRPRKPRTPPAGK